MIPKKIYYVWFGKKPLTEKIKQNIRTWKKFNPDFEIIQINEENFDISKYSFVKEAYHHKKWAFASDVARLDTIYNHGGFYFDVDVEMVKSLTPLLKEKSIWALESPGYINSGLVVGAQKNDQNIKNILDIYTTKKFVWHGEGENDPSTVPLISKYFRSRGLNTKNKTQVLSDGTKIFASDYFAPFHWWGGGHLTKNTIAIQQYANSWGADLHLTPLNRVRYNFKFHCYGVYRVIAPIDKRILS